jgi:hypothetical protein
VQVATYHRIPLWYTCGRRRDHGDKEDSQECPQLGLFGVRTSVGRGCGRVGRPRPSRTSARRHAICHSTRRSALADGMANGNGRQPPQPLIGHYVQRSGCGRRLRPAVRMAISQLPPDRPRPSHGGSWGFLSPLTQGMQN